MTLLSSYMVNNYTAGTYTKIIMFNNCVLLRRAMQNLALWSVRVIMAVETVRTMKVDLVDL